MARCGLPAGSGSIQSLVLDQAEGTIKITYKDRKGDVATHSGSYTA